MHLFLMSCLHPFLQEHYKVTMTYFTDEIATVLQQHYQGLGNPLLFLLHGLNTDSNNYSTPAQFEVLIYFLTLHIHIL